MVHLHCGWIITSTRRARFPQHALPCAPPPSNPKRRCVRGTGLPPTAPLLAQTTVRMAVAPPLLCCIWSCNWWQCCNTLRPHVLCEQPRSYSCRAHLIIYAGIGVCAALALLELPPSETLPPLECLFTIDEETGLTGANLVHVSINCLVFLQCTAFPPVSTMQGRWMGLDSLGGPCTPQILAAPI